jgi:hypothetical protein
MYTSEVTRSRCLHSIQCTKQLIDYDFVNDVYRNNCVAIIAYWQFSLCLTFILGFVHYLLVFVVYDQYLVVFSVFYF